MKKSPRDINIFSMSALDLFAAAMGSFVIISIILFPFYPNTVPESVRREMESAIDQLEAEVEAAQFPHLDLVIALDVTGSMRGEIESLRSESQELARVLNRLAPSVGMGVITFGDHGFEQPVIASRLFRIHTTAGLDAFLDHADQIRVNQGLGSGDHSGVPEEEVADALEAAVQMPWRDESEQRVIAIITDNRAREQHIQRSFQLASNFADHRNSISTVFTDTGSGNREDIERYLEELADRGGGELIPSGASMTANLLLAIL